MKRIAPVLLAVLLFAGAAQACPMCKDTIANNSGVAPGGPGTGTWGGPGGLAGGGPPGLSAGFNLSIFTMFAGLFGTAGLVGRTIYKGVKSSQR